MIAAGDTLTGISQRLLGRASRWTEIAKLNQGLDPSRLVVGTEIQMPTGADGGKAPERKQRGSKADAGGTYAVRSGDSLWGIAEAELGSGNRWREIVDRNPGLDPDKLVVGRKLVLPGDALSSGRSSTTVAKASPRKRRGGSR